MRVLVAPCLHALKEARELGMEMACTERGLRPVPISVRDFGTYECFREMQRHCLEQREAFFPWERRLQLLAEREAMVWGICVDDTKMWEIFDSRILGPIREAFWAGWETVQGMAYLHECCLFEERHRTVTPKVLEGLSSCENAKGDTRYIALGNSGRRFIRADEVRRERIVLGNAGI